MIKVHLSFVVILFLLFPSLLFIFTNDGTGLDDATENIIFNGNASFTGASSLYVRSGTGIQSDPYIVSDHNMTSYNIQFISTTSFVIVRNITFSASSSWAITLTSTRNVILDNITCIGRSTFLYSSSCRNIILTDSIISSIKSASLVVQIVNGIDITIQDSVFKEDTVTGAGAIQFNNQGTGHFFKGNELTGVPYSDLRFYTNGEISNNTFVDSRVTIQNGNTGASVLNNTFDQSSGDAVDISLSWRLKISGNNFTAPSGCGIYFHDVAYQTNANHGEIENNTFESCDKGISTPNGWQTRLTRYLIHHNYFGNCTGYAIELNIAYNNNIWRNIFYHNAGTDNTSAGSQAQEVTIAQQYYRNHWTVGTTGNFWANHRTPDSNNDGIVDVNYTITTSGLDHRPSTNPYFDTTPPTVRLLTPGGAYSERSYIRMTWEASDDLSGVESVEISIDEKPWEDVTGKDLYSIYLTKGIHDIDIKVTDRAGLYSILSRSIQLNSTRKVLTLNAPLQGAYYPYPLNTVIWDVESYFDPVNLTLKVDDTFRYLPLDLRLLTVNLEEGEHSLEISVRDDDGLTFAESVDFIIDLTPPVIEMISPVPGASLSNPFVNFNYIVSDNYGIETFEVNFNGHGWADRTGISSFSELLGSGYNFMYMKATDLAGTVTNITVDFRIGGNTGIEIITPSNGTVTRNPSVDLIWDYQGDFDWNRSLLKVGRSGIFEEISGAGTWKIDLPSDGEYEITLRLVDRYGNYIENRTVVIRDLRAPTVDFITPSNGEYLNSSSIDITWLGVDTSGLPIYGYELRIDDGEWLEMGTSTHYPFDFEDGEHRLTLRGSDRAGNIGERSVTFNVDTVAPVVRFLSPVDGELISVSSPEFRWEAQDNNMLTNLTLVIDHIIKIEVLSIMSRSKVMTLGSDGPHTASLIGMDAARNTVNTTILIFVDTVPPLVQWDVPPVGFCNRSWYNISWSVEEEWGVSNISLQYSDRDHFLDPARLFANLTLPEGEYEFRLIVVDLVGGRADLNAEGTLIIDMTVPTLEIETLLSKVEGRRVTVVWDSEDTLSGLETIYLGLDDGEMEDIDLRYSYSFEDIKPGQHTITIISVDRSGNRIQTTWDFEVGTDSGGDDEEDGKGIPLFAWIAMVMVGLLILLLIIGVIINRRRSRERQGISGVKRPDRLSIGPMSSPALTALPISDQSTTLDLPPSAVPLVEETDEGSGYIRPKKEKKRRPKEIDQPEDEGPAVEPPEPEKVEPAVPDITLPDEEVPDKEIEKDIEIDLPEEIQGEGSEQWMGPPSPDHEAPHPEDVTVDDPELEEVPTWDEDQEPDEWEDLSDDDIEEFDDIEEMEDFDEWEE